MKKFISMVPVLLFAASGFADNCKVGDYKGCSAALATLHAANQGAEFSRSFDDICGANKKFKCVKKTVRSDMNEEMKFTKADNPKARLFPVTLEEESYIYIFSAK